MNKGKTRWLVTAINNKTSKEYQRVYATDLEAEAILDMVSDFPVVKELYWTVTATSWGYQAD